MREKGKVTKKIGADNSPSENLKLAQLGDIWETKEFCDAWHWRYMLALTSKAVSTTLPKRKLPGIQKTRKNTFAEIGAKVGEAIERGDWQYLASLSKAVAFVSERFDWRIREVPGDLMMLSHFDISKFQPVDKFGTVIISAYYMRHGEHIDAVKRSRKAFMKYVSKVLDREIDAKGAFAKTFDRICKRAGIKWRK